MSRLHKAKFGFLIFVGILAAFSCETSLKKSDHIEIVDRIREQARRKMDVGEKQTALAFFDSAYQRIAEPGVGDEIRKFSFKGQNYYNQIGEFNKALVQIDSIFFLLSTEDLKKEYVKEYYTALFNKGDILFNLKRYNDAYQYYYRGKILTRAILDPCAVSEYSYRLAMLTYKQGKYSEAITNFKQCFEDAVFCSKNFASFALQQELLANISLSYTKMGNIDSALVFSNSALKFLEENGRDYPERTDYIEMAMAVVYGNQSEQYAAKGDTVTAEKLLQKSIATNNKRGFDIADAQQSMIKLGQLYLESGRLDEACEVSELLKASLDSNYNVYSDVGLHKLDWEYYDKIHETDRAYLSLQEYFHLKDSMDQDNKILVSADVDKEFQSIEQQHNYDLLSKENDLKKDYLYVAALFSLMVIAIVLLLWQYWRASKSNVLALTNLNKQITFQNVQMEQAIDDLEQSNKDKDKILKVVAHDLRNPIGAIFSISTVLLEEVPFTEEQRDLAKLIQTSSLQSTEMINDLLNANINYNSEEMAMELIDMCVLVGECVEQIRFKAEEKDQKIETETTGKIWVLVDKEKLWRVVSNLIVNAIKFSRPKGTVRVRVARQGNKMRLTVQDHGIGIPEDLKDKIFDAFSDAKRKGTSGEQPFGLGLSIARQIIEAHQGRIWFDSEEEIGTVFFVELPVVD